MILVFDMSGYFWERSRTLGMSFETSRPQLSIVYLVLSHSLIYFVQKSLHLVTTMRRKIHSNYQTSRFFRQTIDKLTI